MIIELAAALMFALAGFGLGWFVCLWWTIATAFADRQG